MFLNISENLAIAETTVLAQPRNNGCFRETIGTQERHRETIRVIAPIDKGAIKVLEQVHELLPRNWHASKFFGTSAIFDLSTKQLTTLNLRMRCHGECCLTNTS